MHFNILFIADWKKIGERRQQLTELNTAQENKGMIDLITRLVRKYLYGTMVSSASIIQVSKRALDNYASSYKWNNQGSMWKPI
jgi:hypothetical protein